MGDGLTIYVVVRKAAVPCHAITFLLEKHCDVAFIATGRQRGEAG